MHILTNQQKLKIYEEEKWYWNKRWLKLKDMDPGMLDTALKFIKTNPKGEIYGKKKYYWSEALTHIIKHKSHQNVNIIINHLGRKKIVRANNTVDKIYSMFKPNSILNQKLK